MNYAKYNQFENDFFLSLQNTIIIFKAVNIIHDKVISNNQFVVYLQKLCTKDQKVSFEALLDIIARISFKLFNCFNSNPEKCVYFLVKNHFEPIFNKSKTELFFINTVKQSKNGIFNTSSKSNYMNTRINVSRSLPLKTEYLDNETNKSSNLNFNPINFNNTSTKKIRFDTSEINHKDCNDLHINFNDRINSMNNLDKQNTLNNNNKMIISDSNMKNPSNMTYKDVEDYLNNTAIDMKIKILINSLTPTLLIIYKTYFEHEYKRSFLKVDFLKKSNLSINAFCKDFFIIPNYISYNFVNNYYSIVNGDSNALDSIFLHEEFSKEDFFKIQDYENDKETSKGVFFTFYKFCIFLIHISLAIFPKLLLKQNKDNDKKTNRNTISNKTQKCKLNNTENISKEILVSEEIEINYNNIDKQKKENDAYSISERVLFFFDYLEENQSLIKFEKKLVKLNTTKLTFIPPIKVIQIIKQNKENEKFYKTFGSISEKLDESYSIHEKHEIKELNNIKIFNGNHSKLRDVLNPLISDKTFLKLENCLGKLKEMFSFYCMCSNKMSTDIMSFSSFLKFLKDAKLIKSPKKNELNFSIEKELTENNQKVFNSRIFGDCIVPKKVESIVTFQKYNDKIKKFTDNNSIISFNPNNLSNNKSMVSNKYYNNFTKKNINDKNNLYQENNLKNESRKFSSDILQYQYNLDGNLKENILDNSFLEDSLNLSIKNNQNNLNNNHHNINFNFSNLPNDNGLVNNNNDININLDSIFKFQGISENESSLIFYNLIGKKDFNKKKLNNNPKNILNDNHLELEKSFVKENMNIIKNSKLNPKKLNFNLFVKALEIISNKIISNASKENKNLCNDKCFELFIDKRILHIYQNFVQKYGTHQKIKNMEIPLRKHLDIIKEKKIVILKI